MMLRPRNYGILNRAIARGVSHTVNDYYRRNNKRRVSNVNVNRNNNLNGNNANDGQINIGFILFFIIIVLFYVMVR